VPAPRQGGRNTIFLTVAGLVFTTGVGFAVGYTVGKKSSEMQAVQLVASKDKPQPSRPQPPSPPPKPREPEDPLKAPKVTVNVPSHSPSKGPAGAPITIVEFSEFQCPFCARVGPTLKQIEKEYGDKVKVVFMHQPLSFHNFAQVAAEASMAAHEQGKFWEMHDKLFANQRALSRPDLEKYAQELGLDLAKFKDALDKGRFKDAVKKDQEIAEKLGVRGTPAFFINGRKLVGAQPFDQFKRVIDAELKGS
jgi:protein-disulfide isomerase